MASYGYAGSGETNVDPWNLPLPGETWDQYRYRLWSERNREQQEMLGQERTQMQMASSAAQQRAAMMADAAQQRARMASDRARNQMTLTDLSYNTALDTALRKDRERNQRVGSVTQSFRNVLGNY